MTDNLWKKFYEKQFGKEKTEEVVRRMVKSKRTFKWIQLYEVIFYISLLRLIFFIVPIVRRSFLL